MIPTPARRAGQHQREIVRRYALRLLAALAVIVGVAVVVSLVSGFHSRTFIIAEVVAIVLMIATDRFAMPIIERRDRGATGEEDVGRVLDGMQADGWLAIHDVYLGRGNVDHIVIGPGGIFTIETKSHRGRINAHRVHTRMLKQAYAEGKAIERVVGLKVEPLLVFSNAYLIPAITRRDGVVILPARMLATHLGRRTHRFSAVEVHELHKRLVAAPPN